jgi:hypothetical protein
MAGELIGDMTKDEFEAFLVSILDRYFVDYLLQNDPCVESMSELMRKKVEARKGGKVSIPPSALDLLFEQRELAEMSFLDPVNSGAE